MNDQPPLVIENQDGLGYIRLNRPRALNALSLDMLRELDNVLQRWQQSTQVEAVIVTGSGERAFSAGADVKTVYRHAELLHRSDGEPLFHNPFGGDYFRCEYKLDYRIANFPKPYLTYLDGITMGGGVGISIHGSHRVVNENTVWAMPETGIGFFPDVGASYFLSQLGAVGKLLAMSGQTLDGQAALELGLGTHFVPASEFASLQARIRAVGVEQACAELPPTSAASPRLAWLTRVAEDCFSGQSLAEILDSLQRLVDSKHGELAIVAAEVEAAIKSKSPTSLMVTLEQLKRGQNCSLKECLEMEYRICYHMLQSQDFYEGVRAALVDKDKSPDWSPDDFRRISPSDIQRYFEPLGDRELVLA